MPKIVITPNVNMMFQEKNPQPKPEGDTRKHYEDIVRENAAFEEYYKVETKFFYMQ